MKAILFDVDDTLYDQVEPFRMAYKSVFGDRFRIDIEELFVARHRRSDEVFELSLTGQMSMRDMYIYRVQKAFEDLGCTVSEEESLLFQELYAKGQKEISLTDGMRSLLDALKAQNVKLGVITNGPSKHQWDKVHTLGLTQWIPKEYIFISGDCGSIKPDRGIFDLAAQRLGVGKEDLYYVGDSYQNDIVGAKNAGWHAVWLRRRKLHATAPEIQADYCVRDEEELRQTLWEILSAK